jgi:hypothetical protein
LQAIAVSTHTFRVSVAPDAALLACNPANADDVSVAKGSEE